MIVTLSRVLVLRRLSLAVTMLSLTASVAAAQGTVAGASTGLPAGFQLFTFNTPLPDPNGSPYQTATSGPVTATFTNAFQWVDPLEGYTWPFAADAALFNFGFGQNYLGRDSIVIEFNVPVAAAVFNLATFATNAGFFRAWNGSTQVGGFTSDLPDFDASNTGLWWGFNYTNGTTFTKLTFAGNPIAFGIDNLQVALPPPTTVPEPATLGLLGAGLLAIGAMVRRKR